MATNPIPRRRSQYWSACSDSEAIDIPKIIVERLYTLICCPVCDAELDNVRMLPCHHTICYGCLSGRFLDEQPICPFCSRNFQVPAGGVSEFPENIILASLMEDLCSNAFKCFFQSIKKEVQENEASSSIEVFPELENEVERSRALSICRRFQVTTPPKHNSGNENNSIKSQDLISSSDLEDNEEETVNSDDTTAPTNAEDMGYSIIGSPSISSTTRDVLQESEHLRTSELLDAMQDIPHDEHHCSEGDDEDYVSEPRLSHGHATIPGNIDDMDIQLIATEVEDIEKTDQLQAKNTETSRIREVGDCLFYRCRNFCNRYRIAACGIDRPIAVEFDCDNLEILVLRFEKPEIYVFKFDKTTCQEKIQVPRRDSKMNLVDIKHYAYENKLYVLDRNNFCIYELSRQGYILRKIGRKGNGYDEFKDPRRIAVDAFQGWIFVTDAKKRTVQVFNNDGEFQRVFDGSSKNDATNTVFEFPGAIAVSGDRIAVCDEGKKAVRVFTRVGDPLFTITTFRENECLRRPTAVAFDNHNYIFVADDRSGNAAKESRVHIYRPDGVYVRSFGIFCQINSLAINEDGQIAVCDPQVPVIKIF